MKLIQLLRGKFRKAVLAFFDLFCFCFWNFCFWVVTVSQTSHAGYNTHDYMISSALLLFLTFFIRLLFGTYHVIWRYANTASYIKSILADMLGGALTLGLVVLLGLSTDFWHLLTVQSVFALSTLFSRFAYRLIYKKVKHLQDSDSTKIPIAIVGAGQLGVVLVQELYANTKSNYHPVFFIDKDPSKIGSRIAGLKVYREDESVLKRISDTKIKEIFLALQDLSNEKAEKLFHFYSQTDCKIKIYDLPVAEDETGAWTTRRAIREFQIEDLLFRPSVQIVPNDMPSYYTDKTVLVTGGGGSIGSELCRQIAKCNPRHLIILDIYENNAYEIQQELIRKYGNQLRLSVEIATVRDRERLDCIFATYKPDIVFHAAAHKHVPLMEHNGCEAIKNNILGTYNTADVAEKYNVNKFILISTDKAVNPTNLMGASKRMCEMVIQCRTDSPTCFAAVRFGNVLGSNGSVIPLFKKQIAAGGPITVTDKRVIRYFMTVQEASQLVMQAGAMAKHGELFVLDMGKPVRIYDLAVNMIKLSGLVPHEDIQIEEIGLRPGEKLYEELLIKTETLDKTENDLIFIEKDTPLSRADVEAKIGVLTQAIQEAQTEIASPKIKDALKAVVPTFAEPEEINQYAETSEEMKAFYLSAQQEQKKK